MVNVKINNKGYIVSGLIKRAKYGKILKLLNENKSINNYLKFCNNLGDYLITNKIERYEYKRELIIQKFLEFAKKELQNYNINKNKHR